MKTKAERVLRSLLLRFKSEVVFYIEYGEKYNTLTGTRTATKKVLSLRCIEVTARTQTDFQYDLSYVAANKNFTYGGLFQKETITILLENNPLLKDLSTKCMFVLGGRTYQIKDLSPLNYNVGFAITGVAVKTETDTNIKLAEGFSYLEFGQVLT